MYTVDRLIYVSHVFAMAPKSKKILKKNQWDERSNLKFLSTRDTIPTNLRPKQTSQQTTKLHSHE